MRGLKGRRIVVAGAATGIGAATAQRLAEEGAKVVAGDVNKPALDATVAAIVKAGGTATAVQFDFGDEDGCKRLIQACVDAHGGIDGLANVGADISPPMMLPDSDLLNTTDDVWHRHLNVNMLGYKRTIRATLPHMIAQKSGAIVNVSSAGVHLAEEARIAYATGKIGVHTITRHVAKKWGPDNIRCNAVAPGPVLTPALIANLSDNDLKEMTHSLPLRRGGAPSDLGGVIAFLLSDDGNWITGQVWSVGGGITMRE